MSGPTHRSFAMSMVQANFVREVADGAYEFLDSWTVTGVPTDDAQALNDLAVGAGLRPIEWRPELPRASA